MRYHRTRGVLCAALLMLSACINDNDNDSGDGVTTGASCAELCPAMAACDAETTLEDCEASCDVQRNVFNANAWDAFTSCMMGDDCTDSVTCLEQAVEATSPSAAEQFVVDVCEWAVSCVQDQTIKVDQCIEAVTNLGAEAAAEGGSNPWDYMRLVRSSTLSCVSGCFQGLGCDEMAFDQAVGSCLEQCGLEPLITELDTDEQDEVETAP